MSETLSEILAELDGAQSFTRDEIVPIPAQCKKCKRDWVGRDAIRAPSLHNCRCFLCGGEFRPHPDYPPVIDALTRRRMERNPDYVPPKPRQINRGQSRQYRLPLLWNEDAA